MKDYTCSECGMELPKHKKGCRIWIESSEAWNEAIKDIPKRTRPGFNHRKDEE